MAITEQQISDVVDYATEQVQRLVEQTNIQDDKSVQRLYLGIENIYKELGEISARHIPETIYESYKAGVEKATELLGQLGIGIAVNNMNKIVQAPMHVEAISNIVSDTLGDLAAAYRTAQTYGFKEVNNAIADVKQELANGMIAGMTDKQIATRVGKKFGDKGMTAFVTKDGKHLPLDFYAKTVTRTKIQTAQNHGHLNRYDEHNVNYVYVTGSIPTCGHCARYRDTVFSTKPGDKDFPYVDLYTTFPLHPNCRCTFRPYIMKFKRKEDIEREKEKAKHFNPEQDPRTKQEARKYDENQKAKQRARKQRLAYNRMASLLGKNGPKNYQDYKRASKWQIKQWEAEMKGLYNPDKVDKTEADKVEPIESEPDRPKTIEPETDSPKAIDDTIENETENDTDKEIDYDNIDFTTQSDFNDVSNAYAKEIFNQMDEEENELMKAYTDMLYLDVNEYLRNKAYGWSNDELPPEMGEWSQTISNVFDKYGVELQQDATLYRHISNAEMDSMVEHVETIDDVDYYTFEALKSTSSSKEFAENEFEGRGGWTIKILAPKGSKGLSLQNISDYTEEMEILLQNNQRMKITGLDEASRIVEGYLLIE